MDSANGIATLTLDLILEKLLQRWVDGGVLKHPPA